MSFKSLAAAAALTLSCLPAIAGEAKIMVMDPYARASTPSSKSGAIFLELMNHGPDDRLIGARTEVANMTQLHTHEEDANGVMKMIHVEQGFALAAGETVMLKRGGKHVMLMGLKTPLEQGATVPLTLIFENAGEVTVEVPVDLKRKPAHGGHGDHSHGTHGHGADG
ncbi:MAG: copper chaperone PCu(A)C [Pseudomonadota bacterium]